MNNMWLSPDEQSLWRSLLEFSSMILGGNDVDVARFGLSGADYEMLVHLAEAGPDGLRMSELAARVLVSKSRLTYRVDRLEARGLVVRDVCAVDRRGFLARLTVSGQDLLRAAAPHHVAGVRERLIDRLDAGEFETLGRLATKVLNEQDVHERRTADV